MIVCIRVVLLRKIYERIRKPQRPRGCSLFGVYPQFIHCVIPKTGHYSSVTPNGKIMTILQIKAILALLVAFGVAPNVVTQIQNEITPHVQVSTVGAAINPTVRTVTAPAPQTVANTGSVTVPLKVPVCSLGLNILSPQVGSRIYFSWDMNPGATGSVSGYGVLPSYTSHVAHPPLAFTYISPGQNKQVVTYTLTETMSDPAYQTTTTCQASADLAAIQ